MNRPQKFLIALLFLLICAIPACGKAPDPGTPSPAYSFSPDPDAPAEVDELVLYEAEHDRTEELMALIAPAAIDRFGEDALRDFICQMNRVLSGTVNSWQTSYTGGEDHRGGEGVRSSSYKMTIFAQREVWLLFYTVCTEDSSGTGGVGITDMALTPVGTWQQACQDRETFEALRSGFQLREPERYSRDVVYEGKSYTGYSVACLQAVSSAYGDEERCLELMELLSGEYGFEGDAARARQDGDALLIEDEAGKKFYVRQEGGAVVVEQ